jgi:hypothetical protein
MSKEKKQAKKGTMSVLSKEYKYENLILAFLAVFAIVLGALIVNGTLVIGKDYFLIGSYPKVFAWVLVGLGVISLLLVALPFYKPSFDEAKHIKGLKKSEFLVNIARVLIFIFILAGFFFLCDLALDPLMDLFK